MDAPLSQDRVADAAEIARLATLSPLDYDREREAAAERLGIRVSTLDTEVAAVRPKPAATDGRHVELPAVEPWPRPVDGAALLDSLTATIRRHVILPPAAAECCTLWIAHTWVHERFQHSPRLSITSPAKRCGKSTLLDVLRATTHRPVKADNISASGVFRTVEALRPLTLLIDEADAFMGDAEELRGILNSGFERSGEVIRVVEMNGEHQPIRFATYAPVALAGIGALPSTLEDRAVPVVLQRKGAAETVVKLRAPGARAALHDLARQLARWAADRGARLSTDPAVPEATRRGGRGHRLRHRPHGAGRLPLLRRPAPLVRGGRGGGCGPLLDLPPASARPGGAGGCAITPALALPNGDGTRPCFRHGESHPGHLTPLCIREVVATRRLGSASPSLNVGEGEAAKGLTVPRAFIGAAAIADIISTFVRRSCKGARSCPQTFAVGPAGPEVYGGSACGEVGEYEQDPLHRPSPMPRGRRLGGGFGEHAGKNCVGRQVWWRTERRRPGRTT